MTSGSLGTNQLILNKSGNVGIGIANPQQKLNVVGDGNFTGDVYIQDDLFVFDDVGIGGITSPSTPLHVKSDGSNGGITLEENGGSESWNIYVDSPGSLVFVDDNGDTPITLRDGIDALQFTGSNTAFITGEVAPQIYKGNTGGTFPFVQNGQLIIQSRAADGRGIFFVTGATPSEKLWIDSEGNVNISQSGANLSISGGGNTFLFHVDDNGDLIVE